MLVTVDRYRQLTSDITTADADLEPALADAQRLIEEHLRRPLESAQRTETLRLYGNKVYPAATPITAAPYRILDGVALSDVSVPLVWTGWQDFISKIEVTYTGGYTAATVPAELAEAIATATLQRLRLQADQQQAPSTDSAIPRGASSVSVGDAKVTFAPAVTTVHDTLPAAVLQSISKYRRRYV